jgi:hypothetical protein
LRGEYEESSGGYGYQSSDAMNAATPQGAPLAVVVLKNRGAIFRNGHIHSVSVKSTFVSSAVKNYVRFRHA